jgi:hypothetical protein
MKKTFLNTLVSFRLENTWRTLMIYDIWYRNYKTFHCNILKRDNILIMIV